MMQQPRRVAAVSVAKRVSEEMGVKLGVFVAVLLCMSARRSFCLGRVPEFLSVLAVMDVHVLFVLFGRSYRVLCSLSFFFLGEEVGYSIRFEDCTKNDDSDPHKTVIKCKCSAFLVCVCSCVFLCVYVWCLSCVDSAFSCVQT